MPQLKREDEINRYPIRLQGPLLSSFAGHVFGELLTLHQQLVILTPSLKDAEKLAHDFEVLNPELAVFTLEPFDESPYSGLQVSPRIIHNRARFFWHALNHPGLFIIPMASAALKTFSPRILKEIAFSLQKGVEISASNLTQKLVKAGYLPSPIVEDPGTFSRRGDVLDIYTPTHSQPIRLEFFGDQIESVRPFDSETQRSVGELDKIEIGPARETLCFSQDLAEVKNRIKELCDDSGITKDLRDQINQPLTSGLLPNGIEFWNEAVYDKPGSVTEFFEPDIPTIWFGETECIRAFDAHLAKEKEKAKTRESTGIAVPPPDKIFYELDQLSWGPKKITWERLAVSEEGNPVVDLHLFDVSDFSTIVRASRESKKDFLQAATAKIQEYLAAAKQVLLFTGSPTQASRLSYLFETHGLMASVVNTSKDIKINDGAHRQSVIICTKYLNTSFHSAAEG
ncbi:MAG: hypothetical protein IT289_12900, partial [Oligoflexia bacterium]|nr:hypothetical protein [Oligoflexia bacterium]